MSAPIHPVLDSMLKLGCNSLRAVGLAFQVYMELSEVRRCWDVQYVLSPEMNLIYLKTLEHKTQEIPELVIPVSAFQEVSPAWLLEVVTTIGSKFDKKVITLAFKDSDSTVLFYKIFEGLEEPMSLEDSQAAKVAEEKKRLMEADLRKCQDNLYQDAKMESLSHEVNKTSD